MSVPNHDLLRPRIRKLQPLYHTLLSDVASSGYSYCHVLFYSLRSWDFYVAIGLPTFRQHLLLMYCASNQFLYSANKTLHIVYVRLCSSRVWPRTLFSVFMLPIQVLFPISLYRLLLWLDREHDLRSNHQCLSQYGLLKLCVRTPMPVEKSRP